MSELTQYRLNGESARAIAASVESEIEAGSLEPGDPLPSVRQLAGQLGVSPATVAAAIADLRARGLVVTRERSRTYISWRPPVAGPWSGASIPPGARDLASGNPDPSLLPNLTPFLRGLRVPGRLYGDEPDATELLDLARAELEADRIDAGHMAIVSGALDGIERVLEARLRPGDVIAVEDPGYAGLYDLLRALGLALRPVSIDSRGMSPGALAEALEEGIAAVVLSPRGQNPTGAALDAERADELSDVLQRGPNVLVVEDDHLGPIAGAPRFTVTAGRECWAAARSAAKSLGPDLRLAVLAGDAQTISRVRGRQAVGPGWVSHLLQHLVAALWADERVAASLKHAADIYRERRKAFVGALAAHGIETAAAAGITVWVPVPQETSVVQALLADGWAIAPGTPFRLQAPPAIRITTSTLKEAEAEELATAIAVAMQPRGTRTA
jgi:DNA-binding transcriptional MocR family regulator